MDKLSVLIITFNEEKNIEKCLDSVKDVADEIVVVDSFSTDRTEEICKKFDVKFIKQKFLGYIEQKNYAQPHTKFDYILSLDADEALSEELKNSILEEKKKFKYNGYTMNRLTNYCGKWIKHSGWYPDTKLRLFKSDSGKWGGINPHDKFIQNTKIKTAHLKGNILHYSYYTVEEHLKRVENFSDIAAKALFQSGKKTNIFKIIFSSILKFIRNYFFYRGFLDGRQGYIICKLAARTTYLKYLKLKKLNKKKGVNFEKK